MRKHKKGTFRPAKVMIINMAQGKPQIPVSRANRPDDLAAYYFHQGTTTYAYDYLGAHYSDGKMGRCWIFRVWAPRAQKIEVVGDFNDWGSGYPMERLTEAGVWECMVPLPEKAKKQEDIIRVGQRYKYRITGDDGVHLKADPYGVFSESLHNTASILYIPPKFEWHDRGWRTHRRRIFSSVPTKNVGAEKTDAASVNGQGRGTSSRAMRAFYPSPMNIYEVHLGSFRTREGMTTRENPAAYLNYREIAELLVPYVKDMGYTHVELLPVSEHPDDRSWGYRVCSYYAPTSRYGTPEDFKYFVDACHTAGIGVILDWVPARFPGDEHGLYRFDGSFCYEYRNDGADGASGTGRFDIGRPEVQSFLVSNAMFWLREYHIDGLRCCDVTDMLYFDNGEGTEYNAAAMAFFRKLNTKLFSEFPDALMIVGESTGHPHVTGPVDLGALGFNFKWNTAWMNGMFDYVGTDPACRRDKHACLTDPLMDAFSENHILPVYHDTVVHGRKSLLDKMFGTYDGKFACMRAFLAYMMTQPGKKMTFMGCEYAPFREWDPENQLEWFMLDYEAHRQMQSFTRALNHLYLERRELWEDDFSWAGYRWMGTDECDTNTISYVRYDRAGAPLLIAVNFSAAPIEGYTMQLPADAPASYEELFTTDDAVWGGLGSHNEGRLTAEYVMAPDNSETHRCLRVKLPAMSAVIFAPVKRQRRS